MVRLLLLVWLGTVGFGLTDTANAQTTENFQISVQFGEDLVAPTTPGNFLATPVASTQIDLAWNASTDAFGVDGYQIFRDASPIATTSLTSYADTGLTPSTTYSYSVRAFDAVGNYSTSTPAISTSTLIAPAPPPTPTTTPEADDSSPSGIYVGVDLESFALTVEQTRAAFSWETDRYTQYRLRWGRTTSYELGFVQTDVFVREQSTTIDDLEPGTKYAYELVVFDRRGAEYVLRRDTFTTEEAPDNEAPPNVYGLQAFVANGDVNLRWQNPTVGDFLYVRVVRNGRFYPADPLDGYVIYEGTEQRFFDRDAFSQFGGQFYTVFSFDQSGNVSSGAVVYVDQSRGQIQPPAPTTPPQTGEDTPSSTPSTPQLSINVSDIAVVQAGENLNHAGVISIVNTKPVTFSIPYERLPEHLKTITVTLIRQEDNTEFTFLLRVNKDRTAFSATVAPLAVTGWYGLELAVFDFQQNTLTTTEGEIEVQEGEPVDTTPLVTDLFRIVWYLFFVLISLCLLLLLRLLYKRMVKRN